MRPNFQGLTILDQFVIVYLSKNRQLANKKKLLVNFIIINIDQDNAHVVVMVVATQEWIKNFRVTYLNGDMILNQEYFNDFENEPETLKNLGISTYTLYSIWC